MNTIQVGGARATQVDFDIPASFGLRYTIADTIGVGGVFRGLRTIPVVLGIARDMEEICPSAWLLNYTNPLAILVRAVSEATSIRVVGLCHSVFWTIDRLAEYLGLERDEVDAATAGLEPPRLRPAARAPRPGPLSGAARLRGSGQDTGRRPRSRRRSSGDSASTRPNRPSTTPNTTRGSSASATRPATPSSGSTSRSASTSTACRTTSMSTPRPGGCSTRARRSRSSGAASTPRRSRSR